MGRVHTEPKLHASVISLLGTQMHVYILRIFVELIVKNCAIIQAVFFCLCLQNASIEMLANSVISVGNKLGLFHES